MAAAGTVRPNILWEDLMFQQITAVETNALGECPVCAVRISFAAPVEESEIITCFECRSALVVECREGSRLILGEAPKIEEDWGE